jgi:hypothetical protein
LNKTDFLQLVNRVEELEYNLNILIANLITKPVETDLKSVFEAWNDREENKKHEIRIYNTDRN